MGRRKGGLFDDLVSLAAMLPWWLGIVIAVVAYLVIHPFAVMELSTPTQLAGAGGVAAKQIYKTLAMIGQYLLPVAFMVGALASALGRRKRENLLEKTGERADADALNGMSWQEFEMLVGEAYRRQGFNVREIGGGGADGGVDLVLTKNGQTVLVQCKQWKTFKVGVKTVRELYGVMAAQKAQGGVVVTSGVFTQEAKEFAGGKNIALIDGEKLRRVIDSVRSTSHAAAEPVISDSVSRGADSAPACPKCGASMVRRTAKQGENMGRSFWGCSKYPACRGIVPIHAAGG
ncbi:MAG: DUF2034 domain-containing protein [Burkholderiales bacterium]|nr:DUF2034 domain-containing protein [Burkholderiales bacterium]